MKTTINYKTKTGLVLILLFILSTLQSAWAAEGNISDTDKYAWSENAGWVNFRPAHGGVSVYGTYLAGYAWAENLGWVNLGSEGGVPYDNTSQTNWGVNNDGSGNLSGYAWSETAGWINFNSNDSRVTFDSEGGFEGYAWSENVGWIHFKNTTPAYNVRTKWTPDAGGNDDDSSSGCFISTLTH